MMNTSPSTASIKWSLRLIDAILFFYLLFLVGYWLFTPLNQIALDWFPQSTIAFGDAQPVVIKGNEGLVRMIGFCIGFIMALPIFFGLSQLRKMFQLYAQGQLFTLKHCDIVKNISWCFIVYGLLILLQHSLMSIGLTILNPAGERIMSLGFGSSSIFAILIGVVLLPLSHVMKVAYQMAEEQEFIV